MRAYLFALLITLLSLPASAAEEGLYPAVPPPGSAFLRFVNADRVPADITVRGKSYGAVKPLTTSPYLPLPQGAAKLNFGANAGSTALKEGQYYTVLLTKGAMSILEEPASNNKLKAELILINASSAPNVTLRTADGNTNIVEPVKHGTLGNRSVNAVKAPFSVYTQNNKIENLTPLALERGGRYAIVVYDGPEGKPAVKVN